MPWQLGGCNGADTAFACMAELIQLRANGVLPRDMMFTFHGWSVGVLPATNASDSLLPATVARHPGE